MTSEIGFTAVTFATMHQAIQYANATGHVAVLLDGPKVVRERDAARLAAAGVEFAYLHDYEGLDGEHQIVTVPID